MATSPECCPVDLAAWDLYRRWKETGSDPEQKGVLSRCARLVRAVTVGSAGPSAQEELEECARLLDSFDPMAARIVIDLLTVHKETFRDHLSQKVCVFNACFGQKHISPCRKACPAHIDIPEFIYLAGTGQWKESLETIIWDNPFPHVCGLVCPAPCEDACLRSCIDDHVTIGSMKACVARQVLKEAPYPNFAGVEPSGKRAAIIGAGPAGLTAGFYLSLMGHDVTVFDDQEKAGGMLRYGIPEFRLPAEVLDGEIEWICKSGVRVETKTKIDDIPGLLESGFDAVLIATGAHLSKKIPMAGIDLPFVRGGIDFLKDVNEGCNPVLSGTVVVIGGGNVAADVAACAVENGAQSVEIVCLESLEEMPASQREIDHVTAKGVRINNSWGPVEVGENGEITFKYCRSVFDENGRFKPVFDPDRTMTIQSGHVLVAAGQDCDLSFVTSSGLPTENGLVKTDPVTLETGVAGIFAGGDAAYGPDIAVRAVRSGKQAAHAIHWYISSNEPDRGLKKTAAETNGMSGPKFTMDTACGGKKGAEGQEVLFFRKRPGKIADTRVISSSVKERSQAGTCVEKKREVSVPAANDALTEAIRCLRCDICIGCGMCELACSEAGADFITFSETGAGRLVFDSFAPAADTCLGCGACEAVCPTGAVRVIKETTVQTVFTGTVFAENSTVQCSVCGKETIGEKYIQEVDRRLENPAVKGDFVCPACRCRQSATILKKQG